MVHTLMYIYRVKCLSGYCIHNCSIDITVKMAVLVLLCVVFLLSVSEVISECPPSSGKTLDVYNNNCIGFYRYRYLPDMQ